MAAAILLISRSAGVLANHTRLRWSERLSVTVKTASSVEHNCQAFPQRELVVSSLFAFMYSRSSTRRGFPIQFNLIVINGGTDETS